MRQLSVFITSITMIIILGVLSGGCGGSYLKLETILYEKPHQTEFVVVFHPNVKYYWECNSSQRGIYQTEMRRDTIDKWGLLWHKTIRNEINIVEPYLAQLEDPTPITQELFYTTMQEALNDHKFIQLGPYKGNLKTNDFKAEKRGREYSVWTIPLESQNPPDWFMVLEVNHLGLMRTGISVGGLPGVAVSAASKRKFVAWFWSQISIIDAHSNMVLWRVPINERIKLNNSLDQLARINNADFPTALVEIISRSAVKSAMTLVKNERVKTIDDAEVKYMLQPGDIKSFASRLIKSGDSD